MNPLLLTGFGTAVFVDKRKLVVQNKPKNESLEYYPHQISHDSIIIDGHTGTITFEAVRWLMKHDVPITLLNWNGNLLGTTLPKEPKNGKLKVMQYQTYLDSKKRFGIASGIVQEKITHTKNMVAELARYYSEVNMHEVERMFSVEKANFVNGLQSIGNLLNYEGRIATFYWGIIAKIFNKLQPEFHFVKRGNKSYSWNMNASDEVNALLNYGYAILESEIRKDINAVGLDPAIGFLHELAYSKTPLVYDLQELSRWLVDLSVIQLLEEKRIKKADFIVTENYHLRLKPVTARRLIDKISLNFNRQTSYKGKNRTYQNILLENVQQLANFIVCKNKAAMKFNIPPIKLQRNDSLELRERILAMSPSERRKLGINKSTLWYQKKRIAKGMKIKVYRRVFDKFT